MSGERPRLPTTSRSASRDARTSASAGSPWATCPVVRTSTGKRNVVAFGLYWVKK
jgi:hypothetical protein